MYDSSLGLLFRILCYTSTRPTIVETNLSFFLPGKKAPHTPNLAEYDMMYV